VGQFAQSIAGLTGGTITPIDVAESWENDKALTPARTAGWSTTANAMLRVGAETPILAAT
jgi:hypothetical protein